MLEIPRTSRGLSEILMIIFIAAIHIEYNVFPTACQDRQVWKGHKMVGRNQSLGFDFVTGRCCIQLLGFLK